MNKRRDPKIKILELCSQLEIKLFVESLNEHGRAPLSAYWEICRMKGAYLDDLKFPVSRSVLGKVKKQSMHLKETGKVNTLSKSQALVWKNFGLIIARRLTKLGLISLEKHDGRIFLRPLVKIIVFKVDDRLIPEKIEDIASAHVLLRKLRGSSKTRLNFAKRLELKMPHTTEIIFPHS